MEYWAFLLERLSRMAVKEKTLDVSALFSYTEETLLRCNASHKVRLSQRQEAHLAVPVAMDLMTNRAEYDADQARRADSSDAKVLGKKIETSGRGNERERGLRFIVHK